jgi:MerR family transcriptional regulator, copper efflux regulator
VTQYDPPGLPIEPVPVACTLSGQDQADRIGQWRRLLAQAQGREPIPGGVGFTLPATLAAEAAGLAAAEQRCCAFFRFTLHLAGGGLRFEVRAPAEAAPLLAEVFGAAG